ncbi:CDP-diacylglycerol--glycerol-3-phosphate 3-phosphatidyltransferase [Synechococcales cyanobacterium C]|uniref:CDP-diacylglycerol--glycerol-3-phosphate 3-phosphatidyltransferase n=1 Tax=Petrachloros mirabilis ULC683 TaxID=2781853 RepID=A0A8K2A8F9_9CYAN|nr:CDP-diacylglycerol--glycerol-3-phosphate 3-phosphatidyltransferase [Petrachloros mirabilis]NCJ06920.1 CDP-diacylglycerol--glycerol-3-phosphate 3-phosphatidyltransferase [Petrachloros mirabilis ULC683]
MTLATWITVSRLLAIPVLLLWLHTEPGTTLPSDLLRWSSVVIFLVAAGTDWVDGYVARRFDQVSDLGKFLDPLVDKLLVLAPLLSLIAWGVIPAWSVFLILLRELAIAGWRVQQTQISGANLWGKAKTVTQISAIALLMAPLPAPWPAWSLGVYALAIVLTLVSGILYLWPQSAQPL